MKAFIPIIAMSALLASTVSGWSGSPSTGNLKVEMKIDQRCQVNPKGDAVLDFGTRGIVTNDVDSEGTIQVQCTKGVVYSIGVNTGLNPTSSIVPQPQMKNANGSDFITYDLFSNAARKKPTWGDTVSSNGGRLVIDALTGQTADGTLQSIPVYGRISKSSIASYPIGTYTDTVTVTVSF